MTWRTRTGAALLVAAVCVGTWLASPALPDRHRSPVLIADFHVHPFPGDGALTVRQLQREALRRGLDVIALTGHNNQAGWRFATALGPVDDAAVIVLPGQEVTAPGFHIAAIGIPTAVDWNGDVRAVIAEIHRLGGAVIASHPVERSWRPRDSETLAGLDGVEIAHPERQKGSGKARQLDEFFALAQRANPRVSAIGSSDFHASAPLGRCRTYVFVEERSAAGVVRAVRTGRTVAEDAEGRLFGPPELVARITPDLRGRRTALAPGRWEKACALTALLGLALISSASRRANRL